MAAAFAAAQQAIFGLITGSIVDAERVILEKELTRFNTDLRKLAGQVADNPVVGENQAVEVPIRTQFIIYAAPHLIDWHSERKPELPPWPERG